MQVIRTNILKLLLSLRINIRFQCKSNRILIPNLYCRLYIFLELKGSFHLLIPFLFHVKQLLFRLPQLVLKNLVDNLKSRLIIKILFRQMISMLFLNKNAEKSWIFMRAIACELLAIHHDLAISYNLL